MRPHHHSLVGHLTIESLRQVRADVSLIGTAASAAPVTASTTVADEVGVKRAMIEAADAVTLLADSTKFPGSGAATVCAPQAVTTLVTDAAPDEETCAALVAAEVRVVVAG